jgi:hypothetical protein
VAVEKTPDRAVRERGPVIAPKHVGQLGQGDVLLRLDRRQDHVPERLDTVRT